MENALATLSLIDQEDEIKEAQRNDPIDEVEPNFCLVCFFFIVSVIHFPAVQSILANFWHPLKGIQLKLGHSDSFCEERDPSLVSKETSMEHDFEEAVLEGEEGKKALDKPWVKTTQH
ncbi:hypothetical protein J1N35_034439 [Gossypium stocksii]|uniref:Uncharacterized protein n=1 Tax=Gossypium stocksii TaxID=47602 RepID=A0A9D3UTX9_9ROSI|nr:hypothetical protein J1N35_034439 [Gossypium stocksii]